MNACPSRARVAARPSLGSPARALHLACRIARQRSLGEHAGHGLRSGFLTSAAESGASIWKLRCGCSVLRGAVRAHKRDRGLYETRCVIVPAVIVDLIGNDRRVHATQRVVVRISVAHAR